MNDNRVFQVIRIAKNGQLWIVPFKRESSRLRLRNATCVLSGVTYDAALWFTRGLVCSIQPNGFASREKNVGPHAAPGRKGHWKLVPCKY